VGICAVGGYIFVRIIWTLREQVSGACSFYCPIISQLPNKFYGHFATPLEYVIGINSDPYARVDLQVW